MRHEPLISVVTIFLNAERFLRDAIESVRAQTWPRWELLLVDDGSTDGSTALAREYAAADPSRIRYLEHDAHRNRGMSASRNLGVAHARGEWLAFLDSDDVWTPGALAGYIEALRTNPGAELMYGPAVNWHSWDASAPERDEVQQLGFPSGIVADGTQLATHFIADGRGTPCHGAALIRRDAWERLGGFEQSFRGMYEDQVFWFKAALGARVLVCDRSGLFYRQHHDSCCAVEFRTNRHAEARLRFLRWARAHAAHAGVADSRLEQTLRRHLRDVRWTTGLPGVVRRSVRTLLPQPIVAWVRASR